jgi:hypothetical protein
MLGASEASKKGLSAGWLVGEALMGVRIVGERRAGGVARLLLFFEEEAVVLAEDGESLTSARGEETLGACLLETLLSRETPTGKRPFPLVLATVIWCALP